MRVAISWDARPISLPPTWAQVIDFLTKRGIEVVVPKEQNCCGAAIYFSRDMEQGAPWPQTNQGVQRHRLYTDRLWHLQLHAQRLKVYLPDNEEQQKAYDEFAKR